MSHMAQVISLSSCRADRVISHLQQPAAVASALFPLFADLHDRPVLVVGGGAVAERKLAALLEAGALPRIQALALSPAIQAWLDEGRVTWIGPRFHPRALEDVWLVVAATDDPQVNQEVAAAAQQRRVFANVVDDAELSSVHVPARVQRGDLQIAISSGGGAPMVARHVRRQLETLFDESWGALTALFARHRQAIRARYPDTAQRRRFFEQVLQGDLPRLLRQRQQARAEQWLEQALRDSPARSVGSVVLVGAGPGDPGLLTLHALRAINEADVILHDRLVSDEVLQLARRDAQRIEVGKSAGHHSMRQEAIHELMLEHAPACARTASTSKSSPASPPRWPAPPTPEFRLRTATMRNRCGWSLRIARIRWTRWTGPRWRSRARPWPSTWAWPGWIPSRPAWSPKAVRLPRRLR